MTFGSVCSGIEAASVAWHPLGWKAAWLAEIEPFPCGVLAHHYPEVHNLGDMTTILPRVLSGEVEAPGVFTGGTPCQAFSVAGKRESLADARGNLSLTFCEIADAIDDVRAADGREPCIVVWENVPGVLSTSDNAFGCFLGALAGAGCELQPAGGRWTNAGLVLGPRRAVAWRIIDAQYFGLAQRRKRVFVVASARDGFDPAAVLFESEGVRRDSAPSREAWKGIAGGTSRRPDSGHVVNSLTANNGQRNEVSDAVNGSVIPVWPADIACTLNAAFGDKQGLEDQHALSGASLFVPVAFSGQMSVPQVDHDLSQTLQAKNPQAVAHAIRTAQTSSNGWGVNPDTAYTLDQAQGQAVQSGMAVRRLTPRECERLQGFPDDYTAIPWRNKPASECPDGPRYKALGNSWAVPCARWIGERIQRQAAA